MTMAQAEYQKRIAGLEKIGQIKKKNNIKNSLMKFLNTENTRIRYLINVANKALEVGVEINAFLFKINCHKIGFILNDREIISDIRYTENEKSDNFITFNSVIIRNVKEGIINIELFKEFFYSFEKDFYCYIDKVVKGEV